MAGFKFIDLFCGIGGFRQALEGLGNLCVFSSDWDKDARETYFVNYGECPKGDITKIDSKTIPKHQILCAGFPCQPFSISGKMDGFDDARGTLLHEILRIARAKKPEILFLENVKNYLNHGEGSTMAKTLSLLKEAGYETFYKILNASDYGVPQRRERLYFVCFRKDLEISSFHFPQPQKNSVMLEDILLTKKEFSADEFIIDRDDLRMVKDVDLIRVNGTVRIGTVGKGGQGERIYSPKGHAITLSAFGGGVGAKTGLYLIEGKVRRLHPRECARLMGFPETFKLHSRRNVCYKQFGNSVAIPVVRAVLNEIQKILTDCRLRAA